VKTVTVETITFINKGIPDMDCLGKAVIENMRHFTGIIHHLQCTFGFKSEHLDKMNCENRFLEDIQVWHDLH
jgi:hypothetical protein